MSVSSLVRPRVRASAGAFLVAAITVACGIGATPASAAGSDSRSEPATDRLDASLEAVLGESNRGVTERVQVARQPRSALHVHWAINGTPEMTLSLDVANSEARELLRAVDRHDVRYRRVVLKGTFVPPAPRIAESVVVRAVYVRPTLEVMRFGGPDATQGRTILDLADELRLAVELGGLGIPSEPAPTPHDSRSA